MGNLAINTLDGSSLASIYNDYKPAFKNLYVVEMTYQNENEDGISEYNISNYIKFHAVDVSFGDETLNLERNPVTKKFQLKTSDQYSWSDTLRITWRESEDWMVKRYHEDWMKMFYSRENDTFYSYPRTGSNGQSISTDSLFRKIKVRLPVTIEGNKRIEHIAIFENVTPQNIGQLGFGWSTSGEIIQHQMTYYVESWHWEHSEIKESDVNGQTE